MSSTRLSVVSFALLVALTSLVRETCGQCQDSEVLKFAPATDPSNRFGSSISVDGDRMALSGNTNTVDVVRIASRWPWSVVLEQEIVVSASQSCSTVELQGDELFVRILVSSGYFVQVFRFDGTSWNPAEVLKQSDIYFGEAMDVQNDRLVMTGDDVHVYRRSGGVWQHDQSFASPDPSFGTDIALDGDVIVLGESGASRGAFLTGAAFVFAFDGSTWNLQQELSASNPNKDDHFGSAVDIEGDRLVVSAHLRKLGGVRTGSVVVFQKVGGMWAEVQEIQAINAEGRSLFGGSMDMDGDTLAVGALWEDQGRHDRAGAVHTFRRRNGVWIETQRMQGTPLGPDPALGREVELGPDFVLASSPGERRHGVEYAGSASLFQVGDLELRFSDDLVPPGSSFDAQLCGGRPGGVFLFALTRIESTPTFRPIATPALDAGGMWSATITIPPGHSLGPKAFGLTAFGLDDRGRIVFSRELTLEIEH